MIMKEDQVRLKALLTEAVRVILKNGLRVNQEISIEGLLGITLDNTDVFLVNINETIRNEMPHVVSSVNQYSTSSSSLQSYLPKLLDHPSVANVLGLPLMESLPSLSINEHIGRNGSSKRPAQSVRRRGSSPGAPPPPPSQLPPAASVFCPPHLTNRTSFSPSVYRPLPPHDLDREEFEPHSKRVHHDIPYGNHISIAPFRHDVNSTSTDAINHESLNSNQVCLLDTFRTTTFRLLQDWELMYVVL